MTTLAKITIAVLTALFLSSCAFDMSWGEGKRGNGNVTDERREVTSEFTAVEASEGLDVYITQDKNFEILVEADENIIDLIGTDIRDGKLRIHAIENIGRATKKIYVTLPEISALKATSGSDLITKDRIETDEIYLDASSGADLKVQLSADIVHADTSSGADLRISGDANILYADASSGANIRAGEFKVQTCEADASSGADIRVNVTKKLVADASSGADIKYTGGADVTKNKSVSGSVREY
ncbi:head GIN domain-containing protein [Lentiprolixibacter aurantiacus]|uniref:DUF2807 domain-containing protein n=1 Tax=Lentiprolixibacter aurantiacus TaxID=2993939 RepID=A0AAE3MNW7_9FLAO|nr:head GIN domain-containing protein [Lentiprolixibacter aurantiacus]MCX2720307.1 DUF2807 domain-containing protein [Lentiprolixibacter aurantiacus]